METFTPDSNVSNTRNNTGATDLKNAKGRVGKVQPVPPPAKNASVLTTRRNQYPRQEFQSKLPVKKVVTPLKKHEIKEMNFCNQQLSRKSFPITGKAGTRALTPVTEEVYAMGVTPFLVSQHTPRTPPLPVATPFTQSMKTPRTPSPTGRPLDMQELISDMEDDNTSANTGREDTHSFISQVAEDSPPTTFNMRTLVETPTLNIGGENTPHTATTAYKREASETTGEATNNFPEINSLRTSVKELARKLQGVEERMTKQEQVQSEQGRVLSTLEENQQTVCSQIMQLSVTQDKLAETQKRTMESQAIGFDNLAHMISSLQDTLEETKKNSNEKKNISVREAVTDTTTEAIISEIKEEELNDAKSECNRTFNSPLPLQEIKQEQPALSPFYQPSFKANKPEKFNGKVANNALEKWIQANEIYAAATKISPEDTFYFALSNLKDQASDWWLATSINLKEQGKEMKTFEELKIAMRHHFTDHTTKTQAVSDLRTLQEKRTVNGYTAEFLRLRLLCPELPENLAKDYFIEGLQADIRPHIALKNPDTVDKAVEAAVMTAAAVRRSLPNRNSEKRQKPNNNRNERRNTTNNNKNDKNKFQNKFEKNNKVVCTYYKKPGHVEMECRKKQAANKDRKEFKKADEERKKKPIRKNNMMVESNDDFESEDSMDCDVLNVNYLYYSTKNILDVASTAYENNRNEGMELITVLAHINGWKARILIDSGAGGNFISEEFAKVFRIRKSKLDKPVKIQYADKRRVQCNHEVRKARLTIGKYDKTLPLIVAPLAYDAILGKPWLTLENPEIDWQANRVWVIKENTRIALSRSKTSNINSLTYPISFIRMQHEAKQEGTRLFAISIHETDEKKVDPTSSSPEPQLTKQIMLDFLDVFTDEHPGGLPEQKQVKHNCYIQLLLFWLRLPLSGYGLLSTVFWLRL